MSILNVNQIQPVGSGQTVTITAADISASSSTITANTFTGNLTGNLTGNVNSTGVSTFSNIVVGNATLGDDISTRNVIASGIITATGDIDANGSLDVDGHTELDNLNVSGVSTFSSTITTGNVGIQTNDITRSDLVGAGNSFVGLYIGDGFLAFSTSLNRPDGYYISTSINALNAGPVTLGSTMTLDGTWVIV